MANAGKDYSVGAYTAGLINVQAASSQAAITTRLTSSETAMIAALPMDSDFNARTTIDITHSHIHAGLMWSTSAYQTGVTQMNVVITAPSAGSTIHYHFIAEIATTGPGNVTFSKTPNLDATGSTVITAYNNNEDRAASNLSTLTHKLGGIWASSGTILTTWLIGSTTGSDHPIRVGGSEAHSNEWELGYDSVHLIRFVPTASCESVIRTYFYRKI
jgi:hypothetical protein